MEKNTGRLTDAQLQEKLDELDTEMSRMERARQTGPEYSSMETAFQALYAQAKQRGLLATYTIG